MRLVRTTMLEVLRSDYVRTARAKGLRGTTVILSHALRNAGTPILTAVGTAFIAVFGGSLVAEQILSIQGVGQFFFQETLTRDLPAIQFLAVYTAAVVVIVNLIVDLSYAWADPRVKYGYRRAARAEGNAGRGGIVGDPEGAAVVSQGRDARPRESDRRPVVPRRGGVCVRRPVRFELRSLRPERTRCHVTVSRAQLRPPHGHGSARPRHVQPHHDWSPH
jgi:hypothetical protein